jgi:hypothetical protein
MDILIIHKIFYLDENFLFFKIKFSIKRNIIIQVNIIE